MSKENELHLPVVKGYTNAKGVYAALTDPYSPRPRAPEIQNIIVMFVQWNEDAIDANKADMPDSFERLFAIDIDYVDSAKLYDVNYRGKPFGKKRLSELAPFEQRQRRIKSEGFGSVSHSPLETPFITAEQRAHIQSMFPITDLPFGEILHIKLRGKRNKNFNSLMVIEPNVIASVAITGFIAQSGKQPNRPLEGQ